VVSRPSARDEAAPEIGGGAAAPFPHAKRQQRPQPGQDLGRTELDNGCDSDRNRPCLGIRLVIRSRHLQNNAYDKLPGVAAVAIVMHELLPGARTHTAPGR